MSGRPGIAGEDTRENDLIKETTAKDFRKDVIAESARMPVLVDFWAPWCGPCKQLTPTLEQTVRAAAGKVKLVKMNIEDHPQVAAQLGIKSIPAVIAFQGGQPVDGFMGALPESQVKAFVERLAGPLGGADADLLEEAALALEQGDEEAAEEIYRHLIAESSGNLKAIAGLVSLYAAQGQLDKARKALELVDAKAQADAALAAAVASLELAEQAAAVGDVSELKRRVESDPNDHQAHFELALALNGAGKKSEAATLLLESFKREPHWNDDAARKQLLQFFESWGPADPDTIAARRRLSALLFS
jgi:putative thioredoxin